MHQERKVSCFRFILWAEDYSHFAGNWGSKCVCNFPKASRPIICRAWIWVPVRLPGKPAGFLLGPLRGQKKHRDRCPAEDPSSNSPFLLDSPSVSLVEAVLDVFPFKSHLYSDTSTGSPLLPRNLCWCLLNLHFLIKLSTSNGAPWACSHHNSQLLIPMYCHYQPQSDMLRLSSAQQIF